MKASEALRKKQQDVEKAIRTANFDFLLTEIPEQIQRRTRLGKGVDDGGGNSKLDPLSEKYVERRKVLKKKGELSSETTPKKSNATLSGQMLSSIIGSKTSWSTFTFTFKPQRKDGKSNLDIARWFQEKGRVFFKLSNSERKQFERKIAKIINAQVKKLF